MLRCVQCVYLRGIGMSTTMTLRLEDSIKEQLEKLAQATNRTKSFLAAEAIKNYIDMNTWQINEIEEGIKRADNGDFANESEVEAVFNKWK